ncbi:uncharacterized protein LOC111126483 [Crassostrea virginica]
MNLRKDNNCMNFFVFSLTVYHLMYVCKTETKGLHFVNICTHLRVRDVSPEVSYVVSWSGEQVPSATCQIGFAGPVGDSLYSRSVCFDTISFLVKDCGVRVEFSEEGGSKATNYSCTRKSRAWCAEKDHVAYIRLIGADLHPSNTSSFKILVTAEKTSTLLILKIGISVGLVCLSVTGILVALCCFKKKKKRVKEAELEYTRLAE